MTTSVTRSCFTKQHQNCKAKTKTDFFLSQTGLVLRPTVSDNITASNGSPRFLLEQETSWTTPACIGDPAFGDPSCIETLSTCHIKLFVCILYTRFQIRNTTNEHGHVSFLSKQYAYWAYFCHCLNRRFRR